MSVDTQSDIKLLGMIQLRNTSNCTYRIRCFLEPRNLQKGRKEGRKERMKERKKEKEIIQFIKHFLK